VKRAHAPKGDSIEQRPGEIGARTTAGHWEMDSVKGKIDTKATVLVLTERLTRDEIPIKMADGTAASVVAAIDKLEHRYGQLFPKIFQTITVDNGSEFADCAGLERSCLRDGEKRTKVYYCHPWSSCERGSNENQNKMIRRWIPKGTPIENYTAEEIDRIGEWINDYPRGLFDWGTSAERFAECFGAILVASVGGQFGELVMV
jgi:IS30 family transposase